MEGLAELSFLELKIESQSKMALPVSVMRFVCHKIGKVFMTYLRDSVLALCLRLECGSVIKFSSQLLCIRKLNYH